MPDATTTFVIRVAGAGLALAQQLLLARLMTGPDYGAYVIALAWIAALGSPVSLGLAEAAVRILPRYAARGRITRLEAFFASGWRMAATTGAMSAIGGGALLALLPFGAMGLHTGIIVLAGLPLIAIDYFLDGVARGMGWFRLGTLNYFVLRPLLVAAACLLLHVSGEGLTLASAGAATILSMAATTGALLLVFRRRLSTGRPERAGPRLARLWLRSAIPMLVVTGLDGLMPAAALLAVGLLLGPAEAGLYGTAERLLSLASFAQFAVLFVSARLMSLSLVGAGAESPERSLQRATAGTLLATGGALAATLALAPHLLTLFGPEFGEAHQAMFILALALLARAVAAPCHEFLLLAGQNRALGLINGATLFLLAGLMTLLSPLCGLTGAAVAAACSMAVRSALLLRQARVSMGLSALPALRPRASGPANSAV